MSVGDSVGHYAEVLQQLREPLLLADRQCKILLANVAAAEALGTSVAALDGADLDDYLPEGTTSPVAPGSFPVRARDGRRFVCDASPLGGEQLLLLRLSGGPEQEPRLRTLGESFSRLVPFAGAGESDVQQRLQAVLARDVPVLGGVMCGIYAVDESGANLELLASVGFPDEYFKRFRMVSVATKLALTDAFRTGQAVLLENTAAHAATYPHFARDYPDVVPLAVACYPLVCAGRTLGAMTLQLPMPRAYGEQDRVAMSELAARCAAVIDDVRQHDRPATRMARLHAFTGALAEALTWPQVVEAVVDMGMAATGACSGALWILSDDAKTVSLVRVVGPDAPEPERFAAVVLDHPFRLPILDTVLSGAASWLESARQMRDRYPEASEAFGLQGESSLACVPLFAQGRCIGGLTLRFDCTRQFLEDERYFFHVLCWHAAQALERARLYTSAQAAREEAERNQRRSDLLADASTILASNLDLRAVTEAVVPRMADWCIVAIEEDRKKGSPAVVAHVDPEKVPLVRALEARMRTLDDGERGIPGVIRTGKSRIASGITLERIRAVMPDPELLDLIQRTGMSAGMIVPIAARGRTLGAILMACSGPERHYDGKDLLMAEELGRRAGIALDNARLYAEAREADRIKDEFLAMLGHELRNPLSPIVTALNLMDLRGAGVFERERMIISRQVQHMTRLVDDLLDVSRITRGKIQLQKELIEVSKVVAKATEMASPLLEQRFQRLSLSVPADGMVVMADPGRLAQVVANLLTNAAKYTEPRGEIWLSAAIEGDRICIRVRDSGIGIAEDVLPKVFDLFAQAHSTLDRAQGGLGIGLTVVRNLVELHGGTVSARSEGTNRGSEFTILLPQATLEAVVEPFSHGAVAVQLTPKKLRRVLVVDDNADAANTLADLLRALGFSVEVAFDAPSALAAAAVFEPQIALLDIGLPVMDGYELARRLRQHQATASIRLVAITGYGQTLDRERSKEASFDEHYVKPVELETLRQILAGIAPSDAPSSVRS
ncbi:MAG TPA: GAF domain-containing protein [Polyangiaceae bacterium]|nr:GAF domain-containing protein [Polyangiaceae bacterium]